MSKICLSYNDVAWQGEYFLDRNCWTFFYQDNFYKAVHAEAVVPLMSFIKSPLYHELVEQGLMPSLVVSQYKMDCFPVILHQQTDYFNVTQCMWTPEILKDALLLFIAINKILARNSFGLQDGHCSNIVMQDNCRLRWCDIGSVIKINDSYYSDINQCVQYMLYPLMLRTRPSLGGLMRHCTRTSITHDMAGDLFGRQIYFQGSRMERLNTFEEVVNSLSFPYKETLWSSYHGDYETPDINNVEIREPRTHEMRLQIITRLLRSICPTTVIDLGANAGLFTNLAAQAGAEVLALDFDEEASGKHYLRVKNTCAGLKIKVGIDTALAPVAKQAQLVLALALTHHMYFTDRFHMKFVVSTLASKTYNMLLTEFMPTGLYGIKPLPHPLPEDYTLENFLWHLEHFFEDVELIDYEKPVDCPKRYLVLCKNKRATPTPYDDANTPICRFEGGLAKM